MISNQPDLGPAIGVLVISALIPLVIYVWVSLALSAVFRKAGQPGWKAWVPILNTWTLLELGGQAGWWALLGLLPVVNIVALVFLIIAVHAINSRFGLGGGYTILAVLLFPVWASILGWGPARPAGSAGGIETTGYAPRLAPPPAPSSPFTLDGAPAPAAWQPGAAAPAPEAVPAAPSFPPAAPPAFAPPTSAVPLPPPPPAAPAAPAPPAFAPAPPAAPAVPPPPAPPAFPPPPPAAPAFPPPPPAAPAFPPPPPAAPDTAPAAPAFAPPAPAVPPPPLPVEPEPAVPASTGDAWAPPGAAVPSAPAPDLDEDEERTVIAQKRRREHRLVLPTGAEVALTAETVLLGRAPVPTAMITDAQLISLSDPTKTVSKTHAVLRYGEGGWTIEDLDSTNGVVLIEGEAEVDLSGVQPLTPRFLLGDAELRIVEG